MKDNQHHVFNANSIFDTGFLYSKALYLYYFNTVPSVYYIGNIDGEKAFNAIKEKFGSEIRTEHKYRYYDRKAKGFDFKDTFLIMNNNCIFEFDTNYCEIYHDGTQEVFIQECTSIMVTFKERQRRKSHEINLVVRGRNGMELCAMEIKKTRLDIDLFYEDSFKETDAIIYKRLNRQNDKGIVLLHGLPGTGKTTYLRYLAGRIKKRILFISAGVAVNIMDPDFIELLINNPNSVLIIEDAENIIMDRKITQSASVSNLLNISDGLLADFLNVQLICTFNNSLTLVDSALLRKGRLIAKYEFGKLGISKSQRLSDHFGFETNINRAMTIAEIANQHEKEQQAEKTDGIGFRRNGTLTN